ncbi:MAG: PQQ-binding-like beta-propeller repeat protein [Planctomycetota bacterium]
MQFRWTFLLAAFAVVTGCGSAASDTEPELPAPESVSAPDDLATVPPAADDWPGWRGPHFDNVAAAPQDPPLRWSETENVIWKAQVPGRGHGSPCLWGERILLPTADDETEVQYLLCYDRAGGNKLWQTEVHRGGFMRSNGKGSHASSTLLADGLLYMVEDGGEATCFDAATGAVIWQAELDGNFSSSPVLAGGHVYIVNEAGVAYVFKAGRNFELVAQNDLGDGGFATPAVCGGRIYLRTLHHLYCLGKPAK